MEPLTRAQIDELDQIMHPSSGPRPWSMAELAEGPLTVEDIARPAKPQDGEPGQQSFDVKLALESIIQSAWRIAAATKDPTLLCLAEQIEQLAAKASVLVAAR